MNGDTHTHTQTHTHTHIMLFSHKSGNPTICRMNLEGIMLDEITWAEKEI